MATPRQKQTVLAGPPPPARSMTWGEDIHVCVSLGALDAVLLSVGYKRTTSTGVPLRQLVFTATECPSAPPLSVSVELRGAKVLELCRFCDSAVGECDHCADISLVRMGTWGTTTTTSLVVVVVVLLLQLLLLRAAGTTEAAANPEGRRRLPQEGGGAGASGRQLRRRDAFPRHAFDTRPLVRCCRRRMVFSGITRSALAVFNKITNQPHSTPSKNSHQRVMRSVRVAAQRCWSRS